MASKTNFVRGSDLLLFVDGAAIGHCTTHTTTFDSETKDRAVKPVASAALSAGLWKAKGVVGLSISISAEGLSFYDETESGFATLLALWKEGGSVEVQALERESDDAPYLVGDFVITSLEQTAPAQDDVTYTVNLENDGEPTTFEPSNITVNTTTTE